MLALAIASAIAGGVRGVREGRAGLVRARLFGPTIWLFAAYLLIASVVTPISKGESASPLLGLAVAVPLGYGLATLASIGVAKRSWGASLALGLLFAAAMFAAGALVLALLSPGFLPTPLK